MYGQPLGTWLKYSVDIVLLCVRVAVAFAVVVAVAIAVAVAVGSPSCLDASGADADIGIVEVGEASGSVKPGLSGGSSLSPSPAIWIAGARSNHGGCQVELPSTVVFHRENCGMVMRPCVVVGGGAAVT